MKDLTKLDVLALANEFATDWALYDCLRQSEIFSIVEEQAKELFIFTDEQLHFLNLYFNFDSIIDIKELIKINETYKTLPF